MGQVIRPSAQFAALVEAALHEADPLVDYWCEVIPQAVINPPQAMVRYKVVVFRRAPVTDEVIVWGHVEDAALPGALSAKAIALAAVTAIQAAWEQQQAPPNGLIKHP